jgi:DDE superfamily endonuclease
MGWSERRATKAAQKLPANHQDILMNAFLREAYVVRDHAVHAALRVNTDQTQMVYQQGTQQTWNESGAKQVSTVGQEEKRAFTLVPSISASGVVLPMQAIFMGKTKQSCPSRNASSYVEAQELSFRMLPSKTSTYWSTQATMQDLVDTIIAPYFEKTKVALNLPPEQCSVWKIDCWSVHKSKEFLGWMKKNHANIIVIFIPGGCTGIWQPLDVGIQRVMKLSIKRSAHHDIVDEVSAQIASGRKEIRLDVTLATLRDRAVGWVVNAIHEISDKVLICKASCDI